jgi:hypothetical protein
MSKKQKSNFEGTEIACGTSRLGSLIRENVYHVIAINDTDYEVKVNGKVYGAVTLPSKSERVLAYGNANYPGSINWTIVFSDSHAPADFITFIVSQTNGNDI